MRPSEDPRDVIIRPVVCEKSYAGSSRTRTRSWSTRRANKTEIKEAVQAIWTSR